jgi:hypothetical protein
MHLLHLRARWYAPETGTFLSKDAWEGDERRSLSLNGWNYVEGNPVKNTDPSGYCIVQYSGEVRIGQHPYGTSGLCLHTESPGVEAAWTMAEYHDYLKDPHTVPLYVTVCELMNSCQEKLIPFLPHGTFSINVPSILIGGIVAGRGGVEFAFDNKGNLIIMGGLGGGAIAPGSAGIGAGVKVTNAPSVEKLPGLSVQLGGSGGEVVAVGGEWVFFSDDEGNKYNGLAVDVGLSGKAPIPAEVHGTVEYDWTLFGPYNYRNALYLLLCKK